MLPGALAFVDERGVLGITAVDFFFFYSTYNGQKRFFDTLACAALHESKCQAQPDVNRTQVNAALHESRPKVSAALHK
jgi:hypothetical protein